MAIDSATLKYCRVSVRTGAINAELWKTEGGGEAHFTDDNGKWELVFLDDLPGYQKY